jgi:hypothetical protein
MRLMRLARRCALLLLLAAPARGWDRHGDLTALALRGLPGFDAEVDYEPLEKFLAGTGRGADVAKFLRSLKVNPRTEFPPRAGETPGARVPMRAVLAAYADEPDWGLDQSLFDHYPELWKDDYRYMGGREGFQTRVFRHMHWPEGFYKPAPPPQTRPVRDPTPLGEAHERCALFYALSREAFAAGRPYWGTRFLAWSLHYLQDLGQPFHATQLPTMAYLRPATGGRGLDVEKTTRVVAYYHLASDGYPGRAGGSLRARVEAALTGKGAADLAAPAELARAAAVAAAKAARAFGEAALDLFPEPDDSALADPLGRVYSDAFWTQVQKEAADYPQASEPFLAAVDARLADTAARSRALAAGALAASVPAPRVAPETAEAVRRLLGWPVF